MGRIGGYQLGPPRRDTRFGRVLPAVHEHFKSLVEIELLERLPQAAMHDLEGAFMLQLAHALGLEHRHVAKVAHGGNVAAAKEVGGLIADRLKQQGVETVIFDRGGFLYHGRIKALADAAREAGLKF